MSSPRTQQALERLAGLTPKQIVEELDRYIVGQADAKKAVAIALRNRWRRQRAPESIREEISPNNIILVGPTGVGKTEIARRLARLAGAPFVKVEASKFTEVGYVGRDVESMVRDLVESAINMVRGEREGEVQEIAKQKVEERLLDLLLPVPPDIKQAAPTPSAAAGGAHLFVVSPGGSVSSETDASEVRYKRTREKLKQLLVDGQMDRARDRNRGDAANAGDVRHDGAAGRARGNGQHLRDAPGHAAKAEEAQDGQGLGSPADPPRRGAGEAYQQGRRHRRCSGACADDGHHLPRRN